MRGREQLKMRKKIIGALSVMFAASVCLAAFTACGKSENGTTTAETTEAVPADSIDLTGFTVVYPGFGGSEIANVSNKLAKAIGAEAKADNGAEGKYADDGGKEILVGNTDRAESTAAKAELEGMTELAEKKHCYSITVSEKRVTVVGNTNDAVVEAVKNMLEDLAGGKILNMAVGTVRTGSFDGDIVKASKIELVPEVISTVSKASDNTWGTGIGTPSTIVLEHNGDNNGTLLTAYSVGDSGLTGRATSIRIAKSTDGGSSWELCGKAYETVDKSIEACWNPHLFELSTNLGDLAEGTIILAGISIDPEQKVKTAVNIWISTDVGSHWTQYSVVDTAGGSPNGMYEPYLIYENGKLYCFYSDESESDAHSQKLVYKTSTDGLNWSEKYDMVKLADNTERPGMAVIAKMGNGKYFGVYEVCSTLPDKGAGLYFKIADSIDDWDPEDKGTRLTAKSGETCGSAPWCAWSPVGGECGTLIVSAKYGASNNEFFVSFDYGETFELVENPLEYTTATSGLGYSASLFFSEDGTTLYYSNTIDRGDNSEKGRIEFAKIKIRER